MELDAYISVYGARIMSMGLVRSSQSLVVAKPFCLLGALAWLLMSEPSLFPNLYLIKSGIKVDRWTSADTLNSCLEDNEWFEGEATQARGDHSMSS